MKADGHRSSEPAQGEGTVGRGAGEDDARALQKPPEPNPPQPNHGPLQMLVSLICGVWSHHKRIALGGHSGDGLPKDSVASFLLMALPAYLASVIHVLMTISPEDWERVPVFLIIQAFTLAILVAATGATKLSSILLVGYAAHGTLMIAYTAIVGAEMPLLATIITGISTLAWLHFRNPAITAATRRPMSERDKDRKD
jgi:hypothetical protein